MIRKVRCSRRLLPLAALLGCLLAATIYVASAKPVKDFDVVGKTVDATGPKDFKSSLLAPTPEPVGKNAVAAVLLNVNNFPALNTLDISLAKITYAPLGGNPPNVHPRASEIFHVLSGELFVAFLDTRNRIFANVLRAGDTTVIPQGLLHVVFNRSKTKKALAIGAFSSENPGIYLVPQQLFRGSDFNNATLPNNVLAATFGVPLRIIEQLKASVPAVAQVGGTAQGF